MSGSSARSVSDTAGVADSNDTLLLEDQLMEEALSSKRKGAELQEEDRRLRSESKRLREESKRLRDEANRIEEKAKRVYSDSWKAFDASKSREFQALCLKLRRNDPSTTILPDANDFPTGYAQQLGLALKGNTHVSSILVRLGSSIPKLDDCGDSKSNFKETIGKLVDPLVQYIRASASLRRVTIYPASQDKFDETLAELFLGASLRNPNIEEISFESCRIPVRAFLAGNWQTTTSLKKFYFGSECHSDFSDEDRQLIGEAFQSFSLLQSLDIDIVDDSLVESIFDNVCSGNSKLEGLKVTLGNSPQPDIWSSLTSILYSTKEFQHLDFDSFHFEDEEMRELINGMTPQDNSNALTTVAELSLQDCPIDRSARQLLLDFMQTRVDPQLLVGNDTRPFSLRKLNFVDLSHSITQQWRISSRMLVSMLSVQQGDEEDDDDSDNQAQDDANYEWHPTIGSQVESLTLDPIDNDCFPRFFSRLAQESARIRLQKLKATRLRQQDVIGLAQCISKVESLRAFDVSLFQTSALPILISLRENGNIQSAVIEGTRPDETDLTSRVTQAYCDRNKCLDGLLLESSRTIELDQDDGPVTGASPVTSIGGKSFSPTLWAAALQVPDTQSSKVYRSLLSLCERIGD
jgi:hypothetical protein